MSECTRILAIIRSHLAKYLRPREMVSLSLTDQTMSEPLQRDSFWEYQARNSFPSVDWNRFQRRPLGWRERYLICSDSFNLCQVCGESLLDCEGCVPDDSETSTCLNDGYAILIVCPCLHTPNYGTMHPTCLSIAHPSNSWNGRLRQYRCPYCDQTRMGLDLYLRGFEVGQPSDTEP